MTDGTLVPIGRVAAGRPCYSCKHRGHGMNLQVIAAPDGEIVWVSGPLPGSVNDLTAARIWGIVRELAAAGMVVLADKDYTDAGDPVPYSVPGPEQARLLEGRQPRPRSATIPRRARHRPSPKPGASCASSAAAPGAPGSWPKPSTSFKPARPPDEKAHVRSRAHQSVHPIGHAKRCISMR